MMMICGPLAVQVRPMKQVKSKLEEEVIRAKWAALLGRWERHRPEMVTGESNFVEVEDWVIETFAFQQQFRALGEETGMNVLCLVWFWGSLQWFSWWVFLKGPSEDIFVLYQQLFLLLLWGIALLTVGPLLGRAYIHRLGMASSIWPSSSPPSIDDYPCSSGQSELQGERSRSCRHCFLGWVSLSP